MYTEGKGLELKMGTLLLLPENLDLEGARAL